MKAKKLIKVLGISALVGAIMVGCQNANAPYNEQKVISIGNDSIYMDEMMYHVMIAEFQGKVIGSYFGDEATYWNSEYENGITMGENKQKQIIEDAVKYEIYSHEAEKIGMSLDETEKAQVAQNIKSIQNNIGDDAVSRTQLSNEQLTSIAEKVALATKYYNQQLEAAEVDEEAVRASINKADYEIYKIQYLFMPTKVKNDNGELKDVDNETATEISKKMEKYREQFSEITKIDDLVINVSDSDTAQKGEISFSKKDNPFGEEVEIMEVCEKISDGEISEVFRTNRGYYVLRKVENPVNPYEQAVKEAIQKERENLVTEQYNTTKKQYKVYVNDKTWKNIKIGSMTIKTEEK